MGKDGLLWVVFLQCNIKTQILSAGSEMMFDVTHVVIGMDYRDLNEMVGWGLSLPREERNDDATSEK